MSENSLTIFERGNQLLAEANTVQKAKELKDLALTAADWAKHKGLGEEAVKLAMSYAMDASRRMGELLRATERNKGEPGPGRGKPRSYPAHPFSDSKTPILQELGITRKESSRAQKLAALPEETFQKVRSGEIPVSNIKQVHPYYECEQSGTHTSGVPGRNSRKKRQFYRSLELLEKNLLALKSSRH